MQTNIPAILATIFRNKEEYKKLERIEPSMITNGVLVIPDDITDIDVNLDECLKLSNISDEIKCVIFPKGLKTISNFFYGNNTVKKVIFKNPVYLKSSNNQGTFESCAVEEIVIPKGFFQVEYGKFSGTVKPNGKDPLFAPRATKDTKICTSFFNCERLTVLTIVFDEKKSLITVNEDYIEDIEIVIAANSWKKTSEKMFTSYQSVNVFGVAVDYISKEAFETCVNELMGNYVPARQHTISQVSPTSSKTPTIVATN